MSIPAKLIGTDVRFLRPHLQMYELYEFQIKPFAINLSSSQMQILLSIIGQEGDGGFGPNSRRPRFFSAFLQMDGIGLPCRKTLFLLQLLATQYRVQA